MFGDAESVNRALRLLVDTAEAAAGPARRRRGAPDKASQPVARETRRADNCAEMHRPPFVLASSAHEREDFVGHAGVLRRPESNESRRRRTTRMSLDARETRTRRYPSSKWHVLAKLP